MRISFSIQRAAKVASFVPLFGEKDSIAFSEDVSLLPRETQVALKMYELELASFVGYEVVLQNAVPFWDKIKGNLDAISSKNLITICDFADITETRETIIDTYFTNGKYKKLTYVYEASG